jgi:hypothetical protein
VSLRVLVVPEDPTHNGYILRPLVQALMAAAGRPRALVTVLSNPRLTGFDHALRALRDELPGKYRHYDLWLFMPDADRATPAAMAALEADLQRQGIRLLVCAAQPEVEVFACVAHRADLGMTWDQARTHGRFKEQVFEPLLARHGDKRRAGGGRDQLMAASLARFQALLQLCPELRTLLDRIGQQLQTIQER